MTKQEIEFLLYGDPKDRIHSGDLVKLKVARVKRRRGYGKSLPAYKRFIENNTGTVFTAYVQPNGLVSLLPNGGPWLFWDGDLKKVKKEKRNG